MRYLNHRCFQSYELGGISPGAPYKDQGSASFRLLALFLLLPTHLLEMTAMHFSSIAIGVGRAVMPRVVRHGCESVKYSA